MTTKKSKIKNKKKAKKLNNIFIIKKHKRIG